MGRAKINEEHDETSARDTRPIVRAGQVLSAIVAAAGTMRPLLAPPNMGPSVYPRWSSPPAWASLRATFHVLPDVVRRECIARLLWEEADRIEHDESVSLSNRGAVGTKRRGD